MNRRQYIYQGTIHKRRLNIVKWFCDTPIPQVGRFLSLSFSIFTFRLLLPQYCWRLLWTDPKFNLVMVATSLPFQSMLYNILWGEITNKRITKNIFLIDWLLLWIGYHEIKIWLTTLIEYCFVKLFKYTFRKMVRLGWDSTLHKTNMASKRCC